MIDKNDIIERSVAKMQEQRLFLLKKLIKLTNNDLNRISLENQIDKLDFRIDCQIDKCEIKTQS